MLGLALIDECIKNNVKVYAIVRKNSSRKKRIPTNNLVHIIECDFNDFNNYNFEMLDYDAFYHFAWQGTSFMERNSNEIQKYNIECSLKSIVLANKLKCHKFIGVGSQAEYGRKNHKIKTTDEVAPETEYGKAKLEAYHVTKKYAVENNINHIWARVFSIYGKMDKNDTLISMLIRGIQNEEKIKLTKCEQMWDYLYSADAGEALYLIGEKGKKEKIYNVASGNCKQLIEYVKIIEKCIGKKANIKYGAKPYSENQVMYLCGDISETTTDIGWKPKTSFEDGIKEII